MMENKKTSWLNRYISSWYGISGPVDEYKESQINRIGGRALPLFLEGMGAVIIISLIVAAIFNMESAYYTVLGGFLIVELAVSGYVSHQVHKLHLDDNEIEAKDLPEAKKSAWLRGIRAGLYWGVSMTALQIITEQDFSTFNIWLNIGVWFGSGILFGLTMAFVLLGRIKVIKDDE